MSMPLQKRYPVRECVFDKMSRFISIFKAFNFFTQFCFYTGLFCAVSLSVGAYSFQQHHQDGDPLDGWALATIILACVFGAFTVGMALTSFRFIFANTTNVDMLKRSHTLLVAVRIPTSTPPSDKYPVIVYPLRGPPRRPGSEGQQPNSHHGPISARDQQAERKFAMLRSKPRENPWNLGALENWKSVMGDNFIEWMLPIRHSPCCNHESMESDYKLGPLIPKLRKRYGVPELEASPRSGHAIEMQERGARRASD
jgi:palmitoyltransferase